MRTTGDVGLTARPSRIKLKALNDGSESVLAWRLGAEARNQLLHSRLAALGALWRPFLQADVFADRDSYLKVLTTCLALELVDSHDSPPATSAHQRQRSRRQAPTAEEGYGPTNAPPPV